MDAVSYVHQPNKNYSLTFTENMTLEETNKIYNISFLASDILAQIGHLPICEIRQLPNWDIVVHYVMDPEAQKLIESFHRYGFQKGTPHNACPFRDGALRDRFTSLIGQSSLMTVYEEQSKEIRKTIMAFFNHAKLEELKSEWIEFTKEWLCQQIKKDDVELFNATLLLIGKCLIKGMLGYHDCTDADIQFNTGFWKNYFELSPQEMKSLQELEAEGKPPQPSFMGKLLEYPLSVYTYCVKKTHDYFAPAVQIESSSTDQFQQLAYKIYKSTVCHPKSLCNYLAQQGWNEQQIFDNLKILLLAGQETVGYLLGYILYEYAQNRQLQEKHVMHPQDIEKAYLETLRLYSLGGIFARCQV